VSSEGMWVWGGRVCEGKVCGCDEGMWVWKMCECEEESVMQYAQGIFPLQYRIKTSNKCVKGGGERVCEGCEREPHDTLPLWCVGRV